MTNEQLRRERRRIKYSREGEYNKTLLKIISDEKGRENRQRQEELPTRTHKGRHAK